MLRVVGLVVVLALFAATAAVAQGEAPPSPGDPTTPNEPDPGTPTAPPVPPPPEPEPAPPVELPPAEPPPPVEAIVVPEPAAPPPKPEAVGYGYENGFFLQTPDQANRLRIRGLVQPRFALVAKEPEVETWNASFSVLRAQIELTGNVFTRALGFTLKTEFGKGEAFIKDAFIDARFAEGMLLRAGQWKRPFSRQQLSADWRLAFFERSIVDAAFNAGRDIGVAVQADVDRNPAFEWNVGLFAGSADKGKITGEAVVDPVVGVGTIENVKTSNVPTLFTPTFVARAGYNFGNVLGYSEMDLEGGGPRFGVAASFLEGLDLSGKGGSATRAEADAIFKMEHVTATGAFFISTLQGDATTYVQDFDRIGGYAQVGVLLFDLVHPALRYSVVEQLADESLAHEVLANATILIFGQNVIWGVEAGSIVDDTGFDIRVRTQAHLQF